MKKIKVSHEDIKRIRAKSDRYAIYDMLGAVVEFKDKSKTIKGKVEAVLRDIFNDDVVLTIKSKQYGISEPQLIFRDGSEIIFMYGDLETGEIGDEELFNETRMSGFSGETLEDVLRRTAKSGATEFRVKIIKEPVPVSEDSCDSKTKKKKDSK